MLFRRSTTWSHLIILHVAILVVCTTGIPFDNPRNSTHAKWNTHNMSTWDYVASLSANSNTLPLLNVKVNKKIMSAVEMEKIENDTLKQLSYLKGNYSKNFNKTDDKLNMDDARASQPELPPFIGKVVELLNINQIVFQGPTKGMFDVPCLACQSGVALLQLFIRKGRTLDDIKIMANDFCKRLNMQTPRVCDGITDMFVGEVVYILMRTKMKPKQICSFVMGDVCGDEYDPTHDWDVVFPPVPKPTPTEIKIPKEPIPQFKVLHLSDNHFDPHYEEGTNADCKEPLCCRLTNGLAADNQSKAGRWGDYGKCDTPKRTVDNMLQHIVANHADIDYIIWTGDLPAHDIWNQTQEGNLAILKESVQQMMTMFPGVPIFPALGNHESVPVNSFPFSSAVNTPEYSIDWLYSELDTQWRRWLPDSTSRTIKRGAFYSVLVRPGFRIISLNMNYCNNLNWWLLLNSTDPVNELQWFIYELQNAEFNGEKVHVLGHIPPGSSECLKVWSRNYYAIISRYESTITAQFFGHTHYDEFEIFYDTQNLTRPVSVAYVGPSVTTYMNLNPGYRIYYVDGDRKQSTRTVLDHETWVMNLKEANLYDYPHWQKLYSARTAYKLPTLLPRDWDAFINKLAVDRETFDLYYKHYYKNSPFRPECNAECRTRKICDLRSGRSHDRETLCQGI
ncbi:sphingomyelin phosphodiesterase-like [Adelges cooleyi]|uniref:sphingomyelin phosphodiesterase-like n=1 Tax=Adelges cooleyi TaxID=133065 RepID=UPI00217F29D5|nr:sphingomyelin phosphodiesterase-like [Adelges cooleyi]